MCNNPQPHSPPFSRVTDCQVFPPLFNIPDYWTEGLSMCSKICSISEVKTEIKSITTSNRGEIMYLSCLPFIPFLFHVLVHALTDTQPASDSTSFFPDACTVKSLTQDRPSLNIRFLIIQIAETFLKAFCA